MAKKEVIIVGAGKFGSSIIEGLSLKSGYNIIVIDKNADRIKSVQAFGIKEGIVADINQEGKLQELGLTNSDIYVIGVGDNIESSLLISSMVKDIAKEGARIIAKAVNPQQENILRGIGITEIVNPETQAAKRAIQKIVNPLVSSSLAEEVAELPGGISMIKIRTPEVLNNKVVKEIKGMPKNVLISFIYRNNKAKVVNGDTVLKTDELMVVIGDSKEIITLFDKYNHKSKK